MKVKGLVWLGTRTPHFDRMVTFCRDSLGMEPALVKPGFAIFNLQNGDRMEVFGNDTPVNTFITHPVAGFLVEDIGAARTELEHKGIEFIGQVHEGHAGYAWTHFRAPDGFVYELTQFPSHPNSNRPSQGIE